MHERHLRIDRQRRLMLARRLWLALAALILALNIVSVPLAYQTAVTPCESVCASDAGQLTTAEADASRASGISLESYALSWVAVNLLPLLTYTAIAGLIFWRRSDDTMALFCAFTLLTFGSAGFGTLDMLAAGQPAWYTPAAILDVLGQVAFFVFFCIFPDGRFVPRWLVWPAVAWTALLLPTPFVSGYAPFSSKSPLFLLFLVFVLVLAGGQVYRYRRASNTTQRQQTKWVVYGFALALLTFLGLLAYANAINPSVKTGAFGQLLGRSLLNGALLLIPIAIAIAILRSRLWDIDILIRRTLLYSLLTLTLLVLYFVSIVLLQAVFRTLTGQTQSEIVTVMSTLLIAALFVPLRSQVQDAIDIRFYRRKYDAQRVLAEFSASVRDEVDLNRLQEHLLATVGETLEPAHVSLWLRNVEDR